MSHIWKNLLYRRCPDCDSVFCHHPKGFVCPNNECNFFITKKTYAAILLDPKHNANIGITSEEKAMVLDTLQYLGNVR